MASYIYNWPAPTYWKKKINMLTLKGINFIFQYVVIAYSCTASKFDYNLLKFLYVVTHSLQGWRKQFYIGQKN